MKNFSFTEKVNKILLNINGNLNISDLSFITKTSYAHTFHIIKHMKKLGIINVEKIGRENYITLTEKGLKLKEHFEKIDDVMNNDKILKIKEVLE